VFKKKLEGVKSRRGRIIRRKKVGAGGKRKNGNYPADNRCRDRTEPTIKKMVTRPG